MSRYIHRGIRELNGEELALASIGQAGFKILGDAGAGKTYFCKNNPDYTAGANNILLEDVEFFVALKAVEDPALIKAACLQGDDFSQTGAYAGAVVTLIESDIIHGTFDKVFVTAGDLIIAHIGRSI
tara:strand:- start:239 stop:619 length:381 start_codon:yes stop_codon:yes gene_type:complete